MPNILLVGNGAREHAIAEAIRRSKESQLLFSYMKANNPGITSLSAKTKIGSYSDLEAIVIFATENKIDFAVIGPEDPLNNGVVDALAAGRHSGSRSNKKSGTAGDIQSVYAESG